MAEPTFAICFFDLECRRCGVAVKVIQGHGTRIVQVQRDMLAKHCERREKRASQQCPDLALSVLDTVSANGR